MVKKEISVSIKIEKALTEKGGASKTTNNEGEPDADQRNGGPQRDVQEAGAHRQVDEEDSNHRNNSIPE